MRLIFTMVLVCTSTTARALDLAEFLASEPGTKLMAEELNLKRAASLQVIDNRIVDADDKFEVRQIRLQPHKIRNRNFKIVVDPGVISLLVRTPRNSNEPLPVVFISSGLRSGMDALNVIGDIRNAVVVAYDYPVAKNLKTSALIRKTAEKAPAIYAQMALALKWVSDQPKVRSDRINIINVSFATFVAPLSQRLAQIAGVSPFSTVFAYGGADLRQMALPELEKILSEEDMKMIKGPLNEVLKVIEPRHHLPHLKGQFLVLKAEHDELVPIRSTLAMERALPVPKRTVEIPGRHIDMNRDAEIENTLQAIYTWYKEIGAFN